MDALLLIIAFGSGGLAKRAGLPPMVGFLAAGFVLHGLGQTTSPMIQRAADLGVLLLLFGIGLKLKLSSLLAAEVWGTASLFAGVGIAAVACVLLAAGAVGLPLAADLGVAEAALVAFALSFSSTVFAVKALDETNEAGSLAGRVAIGVLIIQDILAVLFLVASKGALPPAEALLLVPGTWLAGRIGGWLLGHVGHGELFLLFGVTFAIAVGAGAFEAAGLKPDLGALVAGLALSGHPRAGELADRLLGLKDLLLVAFFLSIGLAGTPSAGAWVVGGFVLLLLPVRTFGLFWLLTRFRLRARTSLHGALTLSTYSEFGLIVGVAALRSELLAADWVSAVAVAVAGSFVLGSAVNVLRYRIFGRYAAWLTRFERQPPIEDDAIIDCGHARALVFGLGRVGEGAYDEILRQRGPVVVGVDRRQETVDRQRAAGRDTVRGDALDREFWERMRLRPEIDLVVACMNSHAANLELARRVREFLPHARLAGIATFADEVEALRRGGVDVARNLYEEAGQALASDALAEVEGRR